MEWLCVGLPTKEDGAPKSCFWMLSLEDGVDITLRRDPKTGRWNVRCAAAGLPPHTLHAASLQEAKQEALMAVGLVYADKMATYSKYIDQLAKISEAMKTDQGGK